MERTGTGMRMRNETASHLRFLAPLLLLFLRREHREQLGEGVAVPDVAGAGAARVVALPLGSRAQGVLVHQDAAVEADGFAFPSKRTTSATRSSRHGGVDVAVGERS